MNVIGTAINFEVQPRPHCRALVEATGHEGWEASR
jgi:hypothetical protein